MRLHFAKTSETLEEAGKRLLELRDKIEGRNFKGRQ